MKAVQIKNYSKNIDTVLNDIPKPEISDSEVLIQVKAAAVNPVELLILTGSVKLIQDYSMPLTLGNECSGIVEQVGSKVEGFQTGDLVYTRLPLDKSVPLPSMWQWTRKRLPKCLMDMILPPQQRSL